MEALIVILLIVIIVIISKQNGKLRLIDRRISDLSNQFNRQQHTTKVKSPQPDQSFETKTETARFEPVQPEVIEEKKEESIKPDSEIQKDIEIEQEPVIQEELESPVEEIHETEEELEPVYQASAHSIKQIIAQHKGLPKDKVAKKSFLDRNPDLEKFIGENLLSKIGIVIFVIGMGFLVKLGIDNNIITEPMRIAIGVLVGGGMVGLAHYLRNSFASFSSVLIGGALAVLYFTIALGYHDYDLIPYVPAFIIMVAITGFGVLLSIAYDRKELAILAILGGFGTPFFLATGDGNLMALLIYIIILDLGMLVLAFYKNWNILTYIAYSFSYILFIVAYNWKFIDYPDASRMPLLVFLTSIYIIFFIMTIIYNVRNKITFKYREIGMLLTNSSLYFGFGLLLVDSYNNGQLNGLFTALVAAFNFGFTFVLYKRDGIDRNLVYLLIGLVLTFVSLIAPIQLQGNYITMFWALEAVLLLWLSQKSGIQLMKFVSVLVTGLMLISLSMDWNTNYLIESSSNNLALFLNKAFIASTVSLASLIGLMLLLRKVEVVQFKNIKFEWSRDYVGIIFLIVAYLTFLFEFSYQVYNAELVSSFGVILVGIYNFVFVSVLYLIARFTKLKNLGHIAFWSSLVFIILYATVYTAQVVDSRDYRLLSEGIEGGFAWHYILLALFIYLVVEASIYFDKHFSFKSSFGEKALWALAILGITIASIEVSHIAMVVQFSPAKFESDVMDNVMRSVLPVVWTFSALLLMILGMKLRLKTIRIVSLVLFTITILKLFLFDLAGNTTGRIVSFILLGVILLVISFLYQKLKFIIQDDDKKDIE